jgi:hypothetical protein
MEIADSDAPDRIPAARRATCRIGVPGLVAGCLALLLSCTLLPCASSAQIHPLLLERTIPLAHVTGRIDHLAVDLTRKRLIVAELGNNSVDIVDLASGGVLHRLTGLDEPQGVAYLPGLDLILVANGANGAVEFYSGADFSGRGALDLGADADNIRIDPRNGDVLVGYGGGGLAVIDPASRAKRRSIGLAGHPEAFQLDPRSARVFVNIPDAGEVAVVDLAAGRQVARWTVPDLAANFPMAIDGTGAAIATVFRSPPRLVLLDGRTGEVSGSYATCADADDVFFDSRRQRIYVSCGEGAVDVFGRSSTGLRQIARVATSAGARTSLFVPELDRLYVAARADLLGSDAAILVFRPD